KTAVGGLYNVLRRAQFLARIRVHTRVRTSQIPNTGKLPLDVDFSALIGKRVIECTPQQHAHVPAVYFHREEGCALRAASALGVSGENFTAIERVYSPFVTRIDLVRSGGIG